MVRRYSSKWFEYFGRPKIEFQRIFENIRKPNTTMALPRGGKRGPAALNPEAVSPDLKRGTRFTMGGYDNLGRIHLQRHFYIL